MFKSVVLGFFKTHAAAAAALDISVQAISQWGEIIPERSAYKVESVTHGELKVDPSLYQKGRPVPHLPLSAA